MADEKKPAPIEVIGVDHIYLTVSDIARAEAFYDTVFRLLDFRKGDREIAGAHIGITSTRSPKSRFGRRARVPPLTIPIHPGCTISVCKSDQMPMSTVLPQP
jgi:hypothetical protein